MDKKAIAIIGIVLILAAIPLTVYLLEKRQELRTGAVASTVLSFPTEVNKRVGDSFAVNIQIDTGENQVSGADLEITFDPNVLECLSLSPGTFLVNPNSWYERIDNDSGRIVYTLGSFDSRRGSGVFASIDFRAKNAGTSPLRFEAGTSVAGIGENEALQETVSGTVIVSGGDVTPTPTSTPTPSGTPTPTPTPPPGGYLKIGLLKAWFQQQKDLLGRGHKGAVILALKQGGNVVLEKAVELDGNGEARDVELPGVGAGTYDAFVYQAGYLTKKLAGVSVGEGSELDFTKGGEEYFLVGDFNGDQEVNVLDFSIFVDSYGEQGEE